MAYFLRQPIGNNELITTLLPVAASTPFFVEVEVVLTAVTTTTKLVGVNNTSVYSLVVNSSAQIAWRWGGTIISPTITVEAGVKYKIRAGRNSSGHLYINLDDVEVSLDTSTVNTAARTLNRLLALNSNQSTPCDLYAVRFSADGTNVTLSYEDFPSTGLTLYDTFGNTNGTLLNFAGDDSQWVYYEAGGSTELTLPSISNNVSIGSITLTQNNVIIPNSTSQGNTLSLPVISQLNNLYIDSLSQGNTLESLTLTEQSNLPVDNSSSVQTLQETTLLQGYSINVLGIGQGTTLQNLDIVQHNILSINQIVNNSSLSNITLITGDQLNISNINQGNTLDSIDLTQANILSVSNISTGNTLTNVIATVAGILSLSGVSQDQVLVEVELLQKYLLSVQSTSQSGSINNVDLTTGDILNISNISTGTSISGISLLQNNIILVDSLKHTQSVGVIFFKDIPDLGAYLISFKPDEIGISYSINLIQIQFGE